ncbi:uncharacterized protein LOC144440102 isoform X2 [Glandiceps talaboti]
MEDDLPSICYELNDQTLCPVCFGRYVKPKTLPGCVHVVCKRCLEGCLAGGKLKCPVCRVDNSSHIDRKGINGLPDSHQTNAIVEMLEKREKRVRERHALENEKLVLQGPSTNIDTEREEGILPLKPDDAMNDIENDVKDDTFPGVPPLIPHTENRLIPRGAMNYETVISTGVPSSMTDVTPLRLAPDPTSSETPTYASALRDGMSKKPETTELAETMECVPTRVKSRLRVPESKDKHSINEETRHPAERGAVAGRSEHTEPSPSHRPFGVAKNPGLKQPNTTRTNVWGTPFHLPRKDLTTRPRPTPTHAATVGRLRHVVARRPDDDIVTDSVEDTPNYKPSQQCTCPRCEQSFPNYESALQHVDKCIPDTEPRFHNRRGLNPVFRTQPVRANILRTPARHLRPTRQNERSPFATHYQLHSRTHANPPFIFPPSRHTPPDNGQFCWERNVIAEEPNESKD